MMKRYWFIALLFFVVACQDRNASSKVAYQQISGQTMGTTYKITYQSAENIQPDVEAVLKEVNLGVNHYNPVSSISKFNQSPNIWTPEKNRVEQHFYTNLSAAKSIFQASNGAFDPTVMPLVNYWGFGYTPKKAVTKVDSVKVDSLLQLIGFNKIIIAQDSSIQKPNPFIQLDFSGLAKGYGVDKVGEALEKKGIQNYLVDIGGEVRGRGVNAKGKPWQLGINTPSTEAGLNDYTAIIALENQSMATSGNYRNYYEVDGVRYAHTLNPTTGYPELNTLLSVTVLAKDCMTADGYATAFMVMGLDSAFDLAVRLPDVNAYFLYSKENGEMGSQYTEGMERFIVQ